MHIPFLSLVIPVRDEEGNIEILAREVGTAMDRQPEPWECIWVDDGSSDRTLPLLRGIRASDGRHRHICLEKGEGKSAALWAGFRAAKAPILATLDGDGQDDPADILPLVELVRGGQADMVTGYRASRKDKLLRRLSSRTANAFRKRILGDPFRDVGCGTKVIERGCLANLPQFKGMHRFLPTLVAMNGFRVVEVPVRHRPRLRGQSKYNIRNRLWVGLLDTFGVLWLKRRAFHCTVSIGSESQGEK